MLNGHFFIKFENKKILTTTGIEARPKSRQTMEWKVLYGIFKRYKMLPSSARENSGTSFFFQKDFHPTEKQNMRDLRTELSLRRQKGEKHLTIKDGKIVKSIRPFLWRTAVTITLGGPNPPTLKY